MSLLGFNALGRLALAQISQPQDADPTITQAAGIGVARGITPNPGGLIIGVAGTGVARATADTESDTLPPAVGVGVAHGVIAEADKPLTGVVGIGIVGSITFNVQAALLGVSGSGVAGVITTSSTAPSVVQASGTGIAGTISGAVTGFFPGASGTGVAGRIGVVISGSGGIYRKPNTGLEPVKRRPRALPAYVEPKLPLPPFKPAPGRPWADRAPIELVDPDLIPSSMLALRDHIFTAEDLSDVERFLDHLEQDEQDAADIADVLALLEAED